MAVAAVANLQNKLARSLVAARSAKGPFASAFASATSALAPTTPAQASQQTYNQALGNLQTKLTQLFQAAGIDTSEQIQLSLGPDGVVQLANSPPDAAQIEQVLSNHPELTGLLQALSTSYQQANPTSGSSSPSSGSQFVLTLAGGTATGAMTS
ncbi:MAG TPA: hypothetical protein VHY91_10755 [Pirellulales bacterium]|jgi:hypothetical protein|nr:hypothetical protein [Pirellulales bacterium]